MAAAPRVRYEFGPFQIDPERQSVLRNGQPVAITPKVFAVLLALLRHGQGVVPKDELLRAVWPGRVVEEANLSQCMFVLRRLLGDTGTQRRYIITLPGTGYRFAEPVRVCAYDDGSASAAPGLSPPSGLAGAVAPPPRIDERGTAGARGALPRFGPEGLVVGPTDAAHSIAVLPFSSDDDPPGERYLADGLSESLITALSQFGALNVIRCDAAFQFPGRRRAAVEAGRLLGVSHVLEGSVRRQAGEVRIHVTLVDATEGSIVWSQRYDRPFDNLFAMQDAITRSVADALEARLLGAPLAASQSDRPPSGSVAAWTLFQQGNAYAALGTAISARRAVAAYDQAIGIDPGYAAAYARLCDAWVRLWSAAGSTATGSIAAALANARAAVSSALRLNPASSCAHQAHARLLLAEMDWDGARAEAIAALRLAPNDAGAQFGLAIALATLGQNRRACELLREALSRDPGHASWYKWLAILLAALGELDAARGAADTSIALQPGATDFHAQLAVIEILRGDADAALAAASQETPGIWRRIALALALQIGSNQAAADIAIEELIAEHAGEAAYQIAEACAVRRAPDDMFQWLERAWLVRDGGMGNLLFDPLLLRYRADPRFTRLCAKIGLPATTDAVAIA